MVIDKVISPLWRVPLFAGLSQLQIAEIARRTERITFRRGTVVTSAGTPGDGAYLIVSGNSVRAAEPGSARSPEPIEPGSLIGELAMLIDHVYGATVVAESRVHTLKILRSALYQQMEEDPTLADHFSSILTERLTSVATEMRRIDEMLVMSETGAGSLPSAPSALASGQPA